MHWCIRGEFRYPFTIFCPIFGMYFYLFTCFYLCSHGNRKLIGIENIVGGGWITQYSGCEEASNFMHLIKCWISKWQSELLLHINKLLNQ